MEKPWIQFSKWEYEDELYHFECAASNGRYSAHQEFYAAADDVATFASHLQSFPRSRSDEATLCAGERDPKWAHWVLLRVYLYDAAGHTAISVDVGSNVGHRADARFTIRCEAASVNRLGSEIGAWLRCDEPRVRVELTPT